MLRPTTSPNINRTPTNMRWALLTQTKEKKKKNAEFNLPRSCTYAQNAIVCEWSAEKATMKEMNIQKRLIMAGTRNRKKKKTDTVRYQTFRLLVSNLEYIMQFFALTSPEFLSHFCSVPIFDLAPDHVLSHSSVIRYTSSNLYPFQHSHLLGFYRNHHSRQYDSFISFAP